VSARAMARRVLPAPLRAWLWAGMTRTEYQPPPGWVRFGHLRRLVPLDAEFGFGRGLPVDRYYIERFLAVHAADVCGRVLEIADDTYARRFGGADVTGVDVLHVAGNGKATIVADLADGHQIPSAHFDCVILTQTLQFIYDVRGALATVSRILRPGGVVLATMPGISQISRYDMERWGQFWSFTSLSARRLFETAFTNADVQIEAHGNVLAAVALLHGLATEEIGRRALDYCDPDYEVIITARAVRPS
jgi:SAM-dependent methyltransferase